MKSVVLIRHGQSLGQTAHRRGQHRKDPSLHDCFLTSKGIWEAQQLRFHNSMHQYDFDLVCTSPLSRALATSILAFGHHLTVDDDHEMEEGKTSGNTTKNTVSTSISFIARADICEIGKIPENKGRPLATLIKDVKKKLSTVSPYANKCIDEVDFSMVPASWPERTRGSESDSLDNFLHWLRTRPEQNIAVVCHHNVILMLLKNEITRVPNCEPIECVLTDDGELMLREVRTSIN